MYCLVMQLIYMVQCCHVEMTEEHLVTGAIKHKNICETSAVFQALLNSLC